MQVTIINSTTFTCAVIHNSVSTNIKNHCFFYEFLEKITTSLLSDLFLLDGPISESYGQLNPMHPQQQQKLKYCLTFQFQQPELLSSTKSYTISKKVYTIYTKTIRPVSCPSEL